SDRSLPRTGAADAQAKLVDLFHPSSRELARAWALYHGLSGHLLSSQRGSVRDESLTDRVAGSLLAGRHCYVEEPDPERSRAPLHRPSARLRKIDAGGTAAGAEVGLTRDRAGYCAMIVCRFQSDHKHSRCKLEIDCTEQCLVSRIVVIGNTYN